MLIATQDWVQDAAREQLRRKARRRRTAGLYDTGKLGWSYRLWESYDAAQGWIVVTLIGAAIGLNAAFLNIVTEWLSDIKLGYCTTAFYLNESFCCLGEDNGEHGEGGAKGPWISALIFTRLRRLAQMDWRRANQLCCVYGVCGK